MCVDQNARIHDPRWTPLHQQCPPHGKRTRAQLRQLASVGGATCKRRSRPEGATFEKDKDFLLQLRSSVFPNEQEGAWPTNPHPPTPPPRSPLGHITQPTLTHLPPGMVSNSLVNWWQKKRRFFTRPLTPYGGACEVPITLEECREHRASSEAAQPERLPPTWHNSHSPSGFGGATAFCESKGRRLATHSECCAAGSAFGGKKSDGNQWAPCSGDGDNQWVQVGTSRHAECKKHTPQHGKPAWGTRKAKQCFENYVLCAGTVDPLAHSSFDGNCRADSRI